MENVSVEGVRSAAIESGIRYANRLDLVLFELAEKTKTASVFTLNAFVLRRLRSHVGILLLCHRVIC